MINKLYLCKWTNHDTGDYYYLVCKSEDLGVFPPSLGEYEESSWYHESLVYFYTDTDEYKDYLHDVAFTAIHDPKCLN